MRRVADGVTSASLGVLGGLTSRSLPLVHAVIINGDGTTVEAGLLRLQLSASRWRQNATPTPGSSNCRAPAMGELS